MSVTQIYCHQVRIHVYFRKATCGSSLHVFSKPCTTLTLHYVSFFLPSYGKSEPETEEGRKRNDCSCSSIEYSKMNLKTSSEVETRALLDKVSSFDKNEGLFNLGHPLLNRIAECFVKAAGVSSIQYNPFLFFSVSISSSMCFHSSYYSPSLPDRSGSSCVTRRLFHCYSRCNNTTSLTSLNMLGSYLQS